MFALLRKIDEMLFSPPHRIEAVLGLVAARVGVDLDTESEGLAGDMVAQEEVETSPHRDTH